MSLVEKPFYFRDQSCLPRLFNQLPGITCQMMVKAASKSHPRAAGAGPLLCYNLYIRQQRHYRCHQMTLNHKTINTHQDGKATTNCSGHASLLSRFSVTLARTGSSLALLSTGEQGRNRVIAPHYSPPQTILFSVNKATPARQPTLIWKEKRIIA